MKEKLVRQWKKVYEEDLNHLVSELKDSIGPMSLVVLSGDLGAGKTTFVRAFSLEDELTSPTYSVIAEGQKVVHADFYRIEKEEDLYTLELELYLDGKEFLLIEWGEKYLRFLNREIGDDFKFFHLTLTNNELTKRSSRDYILTSIDRNSL